MTKDAKPDTALHAIRRFQDEGHFYRHAMNFNTDEVFLQRLDDEPSPTEQWGTLLRYSPNCDVFEAESGKKIGRFRTEGGHWVFIDTTGDAHELVMCVAEENGPEALLDSEVEISKRWLANQSGTGNGISEAMIDAYLTAQRRTVEQADKLGRPNIGGLHKNTVREACRNGLAASFALAKAEQPSVSSTGDLAFERWDGTHDELVGEAERIAANLRTSGRYLAASIMRLLIAEVNAQNAAQVAGAERHSIEGTVTFMREDDASKQVCICCPKGGGHIFSRRVEWGAWETNRPKHFGNGPGVFVDAKITDFNRNEGKRVRLTVEVLPDDALRAARKDQGGGEAAA